MRRVAETEQTNTGERDSLGRDALKSEEGRKLIEIFRTP